MTVGFVFLLFGRAKRLKENYFRVKNTAHRTGMQGSVVKKQSIRFYLFPVHSSK